MSDEIYDLIKTYPSDGTGFRRMAADMISLRAQVATLTAERDELSVLWGNAMAEINDQAKTLSAERERLSERWGESQAELARVKALVADEPAVGEVSGNDWSSAILYNDMEPGTILIARPNLEQKP